METLERYLAEHPFLAGLSREHIQLITGCASNVKYDAGHYIDRAGEEADRFHIIRSGKVAIELFNPTAGPITIQTLGDGEVMGWSWLFQPYIHHFDARAMELTRAIMLDAKCLRTKLDQDHELAYELLKRFAHVLEQRLEGARMQLLDIYR